MLALNSRSSRLQLIKTNRDRLPPYQFLIAFPQLISRICHPNTDVFAHLEVCGPVVNNITVSLHDINFILNADNRAQATKAFSSASIVDDGRGQQGTA